jgi:diguanylate cyclase (GGDEF)-like protein
MEPEQDRTFTAPIRKADPARRLAFLVVLDGPQVGQVFRLQPGREHVIGRKEGIDVEIDDEAVSRRHALLAVDGEGAWLTDLESANGTWVDGRRVQEARLKDGDRIVVGGHTTLKFVHADELEARYQLRVAEGMLQDPVTGLHDRRYLQDRLVGEISSAQRHGRPISVLLVALDRVNALREAHGHGAGDEALQLVAFVVRAAIRKEDVVARFGCDDFAVLARETGLQGARVLGERLRRAVERSSASGPQAGEPLAVSIGAATVLDVNPGELEEASRGLLETAGAALGLARQGRHQRVVARSVSLSA